MVSTRGWSLLLVVGGIGDETSDDEHDLDFHGSLEVVALLKAPSAFHDAAFRVGEVVLVFGTGAWLGWFWGFATGLASGLLFFGFSLGEFLLVLCQFFFKADFGAFFEDRFGFLELGEAVFTTIKFFWNGEAVLQRGAVGLFGFFEEFGDLVLGEFDFFFHGVVAHRALFAGVGKELGAISRDGELADFEDIGEGREFEDLVKAGGKEGLVFTAKFAN